MSKTLYITDLDGTLLSADATLSSLNAERIASLTARGALISCATARTPGTVQKLMAPARLSVPAIVMTGAAMWTINTAHPRFENIHFIPTGNCAVLDHLFAEARVTPFVYNIDPEDSVTPISFHFAAEHMSDAEKNFAKTRSHLELKRFVHDSRPSDTDSRVLYFAMGPEASVVPLAEAIARMTDCAFSSYPDNYNPGLHLLEVFAPGVSKAAALRKLAASTGAERTVVFGDNLNDLPMMACATLSVAAPGALPEVKERADIVLKPSPTAVADFMAADFEENRL